MNSKEWSLQFQQDDVKDNNLNTNNLHKRRINSYRSNLYTNCEVQSQKRQDDNLQPDQWDGEDQQDFNKYSYLFSSQNEEHNQQTDTNKNTKLEYQQGSCQDAISELYPEKQEIYQESTHYEPNQNEQQYGCEIQIQGDSFHNYENERYNQNVQETKQQQKVVYNKSIANRNPRNQTYELDDQVLEEDDRIKLASKVKQLFAKSNQQQNKKISPKKGKNQTISVDVPQRRKRKKRVPITRQLIQKLKVNFQHYVSSLRQPYKQRMTFREISNRIGISTTEVKHLYDQYNKDPLFMSRLSRFNQGSTLTRVTTQLRASNAHSHAITARRLHFMSELIKRNGFLSQTQIAKQMSKVESLHQLDTNGQKIPITRKIIQHLMRISKLQPKNMQVQVLNINTPEAISNRFRYATRYLELTQQPNSDIYFMGEFSFANNQSLSSCSPLRRQNFCEIKPKANSKSDKSETLSAKCESEPQRYTKYLQYLMIMSLQGVVFYQLFNHMFEEMDFSKTVMDIGKAINDKNPKMKKYLVLETSFLHRRDDLLNLQKKHSIKILFLPPQTPMLNPTEYLFNEIKTVTRSKAYKHKKSISTILIEVLDMMKDKTMSSYYSCIRPYIKLALLKQPFK